MYSVLSSSLLFRTGSPLEKCSIIPVSIEGLRTFQSNSDCFVTEIKSDAKNTLLTPSIVNNLEASGESFAESELEKSAVPLFKNCSSRHKF